MTHTIDEQYAWLQKYQVNPVVLGTLCEQNPALRKSWEHFKTMYELCRAGVVDEQTQY